MKNGKIIDELGDIHYYKDDVYHREDGPAVECANGSKFWWVDGKRHREDGPAMEWNNGWKAWHLNGIGYLEEDYKFEVRKIKLQRIKELLK